MNTEKIYYYMKQIIDLLSSKNRSEHPISNEFIHKNEIRKHVEKNKIWMQYRSWEMQKDQKSNGHVRASTHMYNLTDFSNFFRITYIPTM